MAYEVTIRRTRQESEKHTVDATDYGVEGQFTTFWRKGEGDKKDRVASFKTSLVESISEVKPAQSS